MTDFFQRLFTKYPIRSRRFLEQLPGTMSWTLILLPLWASLLIPTYLSYFILFFDVYWFYRSFSLVVWAYVASRKIAHAEKQDWNARAQAVPLIGKVHHILIIPNYQERVEKLRVTLSELTKQTFPLTQIHVVLAMEEREADAKEKAEILISEYKHEFGSIFATFHPDVIGEVKGKSSNEAYGGRVAYKKLFLDGKLDIDFATASSVDADAIFDPQYCAYLAYSFLTDTKRYHKFWQSATLYFNNIWDVPAPTRVISFFGSYWRMAVLVLGDRLITNSTYSLSFKMLRDIDFWDVDCIPEDYRIFFKAFYRLKGQVWVEPIFLKTTMDAALSQGYIKSLKNKYEQEKRWSWGVSDDPLFIKWWLTVPNIPFVRKTVLLYHVLLDHTLWPVNWFVISVAANIMPFINPIYSRTRLGYELPKLAGAILTSCIFAMFAMIVIDYSSNPKNKAVPLKRKILFPFEFLLMPFVGFFLSALPALISHTQLMRGKRMEYKVTEKI